MTNEHPMATDIPEPKMKLRKGISPIWILPIVAILIAGWIVYKSIVEAGIKVTITFENAQGIEKGKTRVIYRGMPIGIVKDLSINKDFRTINVLVEFVREAQAHLRKNTRFWMVEPTISPRGISGLETILKGNYLTMLPGDGPEERHFVALSKPPPFGSHEPGGLSIHLTAGTLGSLSPGSEVYYKGIKVGEVQDFHVDDKEKILIDVYICKEYCQKVRKSSQFYNVSGITFEGSLSGFKVAAEALSALMMGGIAFFTPEEAQDAPPAVDGDSFTLFDDRSLAEQEGKRITLIFDQAKGITNRTQVQYKGVEIGRVFKIELNDKRTAVQVTASIQSRYHSLLREGTQFWLVEPELGLAGAKNLETIVSGTYITLRPGEGKPQRTFKVLGEPPPAMEPAKGLHVILKAERLGSIKANDPVYYRQVKVGKVTGYGLSNDATAAVVSVDIERSYAPLVRTTSKFWNASGIKIDVGLFKGAKVQTESMQALLDGGIAFATPDQRSTAAQDDSSKKGVELEGGGSKRNTTKDETDMGNAPTGTPAANGATFVLHEEPNDEWLKWRPVIMLKK
jgi:paraquat-inducible protein B